MSAYYGVQQYAPQRVLCHRVQVQTYERTLPNGKTITVRGYSRDGQAANVEAQSRRIKNENYGRTATEYSSKGRASLSRAGTRISDAYGAAKTAYAIRKDLPNMSAIRRNEAREGARGAVSDLGDAATNYGNYALTKARQASYNVANFVRDTAETMSIGIGNFIEEVKYGANVAAAAGGKYYREKIAPAVKRAYEAGKSFIERLLGKVREIGSNISKAVSGAYNTAKQAVNDFIDSRRPSTSGDAYKDESRGTIESKRRKDGRTNSTDTRSHH